MRVREIVESHGIIWIGPKPEHIRTMGDKIEAKAHRRALGLPLVPAPTARSRTSTKPGGSPPNRLPGHRSRPPRAAAGAA
jgi:biotin carboxylase